MNFKIKVILGTCISITLISVITVFLVLKNNKSYNVNFDSDGGSYALPQIIRNGNYLVKPNDPTKEGYKFVRWELNGVEFDFTTPVEEDMLLKAIWEKEVVPVETYKVTFNIDGVTKELELKENDEINFEELGFKEKDGYEIVWYLNGEKYDFSVPLKENITLLGKYVKVDTVTIKFDSVGGDKVASQKVEKGGKATAPKAISKRGYIFDGWYLNDKKYDFNTEVNKNITLKAKWKEDSSIPKYTVKFDSDKGSSVSSQKVIEKDKATVPKTPTKSGYKFVEWQLNGKKYDFNTPVTKDITLKAVWRELKKYKVTFDSNGGSIVSPQEVLEDEKIKEPVKPTKENYNFKEWQLNGKKYDFNTKVTSDLILKAVWEEKPIVIKYTVSFDSNGGTSISSQTVEAGNNAKEPTKPTKNGYTFKGWKLNGSDYNFDKAVNSDITLVASWEEIKVQDKYTWTATKADKMASPDSILQFKHNGKVISVKEVKFTNGKHLCYGSNLSVMTTDVDEENTLIIVLNDGSEVRATRE